MALQIHDGGYATPIEFDEYLDYLNTSIDVGDPGSLIASAPMLRRLAANRGFLGRWFAEHLPCPGGAFQAGNYYNFQSFVLAVTDQYLLRANFWKPLRDISDRSGAERAAFGYGVAHNHNFHLLTVGYFGRGYDTETFRLESDPQTLSIGDVAVLRPLGTRRLGTGDVMFYEAYSDVHTQIAPEDLSVSINLMTHSRRDALPQHVFDTTTGRVSSLVGSPIDADVSRLRLARMLLPDECDRRLREIRDHDPSPRVRTLAADALAQPVR